MRPRVLGERFYSLPVVWPMLQKWHEWLFNLRQTRGGSWLVRPSLWPLAENRRSTSAQAIFDQRRERREASLSYSRMLKGGQEQGPLQCSLCQAENARHDRLCWQTERRSYAPSALSNVERGKGEGLRSGMVGFRRLQRGRGRRASSLYGPHAKAGLFAAVWSGQLAVGGKEKANPPTRTVEARSDQTVSFEVGSSHPRLHARIAVRHIHSGLRCNACRAGWRLRYLQAASNGAPPARSRSLPRNRQNSWAVVRAMQPRPRQLQRQQGFIDRGDSLLAAGER